jgi:uncharacterized protein YecE (DUF72 family)
VVKVGCCGFPGGRQNYIGRFRLVEVQQTFYKLPRLATAIGWRRQAPPGFEFTLKAWQAITHPTSSPTYRRAGLNIAEEAKERYGYFRPSDEVWQAWLTTQEITRALEARVIVFQCPASFRDSQENAQNFRHFFRRLPRGDLHFAWEPQGPWRPEIVRQLCQELELVHCVDPFEAQPLYGEFQYFRLHGGPGYQYSYRDAELDRMAGLVAQRDSYVLFNNLSMAEDAWRFLQRLRR